MGLFRPFLIGSQAVRRSGSAALDLCYIVSCRCDGFWELDIQPWNTAAGTSFLEDAGGRVTNFTGKMFYVESKEILASTGQIY